MSDPVVHLIFIGLIALVPQKDSAGLTSITAYLVKDGKPSTCNHDPKLIIEGAATVAKGDLCKTSGGNLYCNLEKFVSVSLETNRTQAVLPTAPATELPANKDKNEGGSPGWLLQMANVEPSAAKPRDEAQLRALADAEFSFGWEEAMTCAFDEGGEKKVRAFKFVQGGFEARHHQAVAESVMFVSRVKSQYVNLVLKKDADETIVKLDCTSGRCPVLRFSNEVENTCNPTNPSAHFHMYYSLAKQANRTPHPRRTPSFMKRDDVTFSCADVIAASVPLSFSMKDKGSRKEGKLIKAMKKNLVKLAGPKPDDRLICPPIVFGE